MSRLTIDFTPPVRVSIRCGGGAEMVVAPPAALQSALALPPSPADDAAFASLVRSLAQLRDWAGTEAGEDADALVCFASAWEGAAERQTIELAGFAAGFDEIHCAALSDLAPRLAAAPGTGELVFVLAERSAVDAVSLRGPGNGAPIPLGLTEAMVADLFRHSMAGAGTLLDVFAREAIGEWWTGAQPDWTIDLTAWTDDGWQAASIGGEAARAIDAMAIGAIEPLAARIRALGADGAWAVTGSGAPRLKALLAKAGVNAPVAVRGMTMLSAVTEWANGAPTRPGGSATLSAVALLDPRTLNIDGERDPDGAALRVRIASDGVTELANLPVLRHRNGVEIDCRAGELVSRVRLFHAELAAAPFATFTLRLRARRIGDMLAIAAEIPGLAKAALIECRPDRPSTVRDLTGIL